MLLRCETCRNTDLRARDVDDACSLFLEEVGDEAVLESISLSADVSCISPTGKSQQETVLRVILCQKHGTIIS